MFQMSRNRIVGCVLCTEYVQNIVSLYFRKSCTQCPQKRPTFNLL